MFLVVAVGLEAAALLAYALLSRTVLAPDSPPLGVQLRINMSSLALSHVVPGGTAPGGALAYRLSSDEGVPGSVAAFGLAAQGIGSAVVLNVIFWSALVISIPLSGYNRLYGFAALAGRLPAPRLLRHGGPRDQGPAPRRRLAAPRRGPRPLHDPRRRLADAPAGRRPHHAAADQPARPVRGPRAGRRPTGSSTRRACGSSCSPSATSSRPSTCSSPTASRTCSPCSRSPLAASASSRACSSPRSSASACPPRSPRSASCPGGSSTSGCRSPLGGGCYLSLRVRHRRAA